MKYVKTYNMLGLCARAGKCRFGVDSCRGDMAKGVSRLIVVSEGISRNSSEKVIPLARAKGIEVIVLPGERDDLGKALGRPGARTVSVSDGHFARSIMDTFILEESSHTGGGARTYVED